MRKVVVHQFISLDGVIQAPGGATEDTDGGFVHGGWTMPFWHDDIGKRFFEAFEQTGALLLGRKTWEIHGGAFEKMDGDPFADAMNVVPKFVVSTTLHSADLWRNSTLIKENVIEEVKKLKEQSGKNIMIDGSSVLCHTLIEHDLIDEFMLHVYPVSLGQGKKLFPEGKRVNLELVKVDSLPTGVVYQEYKLKR